MGAGDTEQIGRLLRSLRRSLAMCKKIVTRLGGRIWVVSEVGQGSEFLFTLARLPGSTSSA